jgi:hypothetical protein
MPKAVSKKRRVIDLAKPSKTAFSKIATALFTPVDKNPYYQGSRAIANLRDLREHLDAFGPEEAVWLASWLEYLGDSETATKIRAEPDQFKQIVAARYEELKEFIAS